jgi:hypothetical protein
VIPRIKNARNGHEMERLAMILDALKRDGYDVNGSGAPTYVFELVSRMYFGVEAADVSSDYGIIDNLIGTQRVALPVDIISLINKSRLQGAKLAKHYVDDGERSRGSARYGSTRYGYRNNARGGANRGGGMQGYQNYGGGYRRGGGNGGANSFNGPSRGAGTGVPSGSTGTGNK